LFTLLIVRFPVLIDLYVEIQYQKGFRRKYLRNKSANFDTFGQILLKTYLKIEKSLKLNLKLILALIIFTKKLFAEVFKNY